MASITILDEKGSRLFTTDLSGNGIGRYLRSALNLRSASQVRTILTRPVADGFEQRELVLSTDADVPIGGTNALSLSAGANITVGFHAPGDRLFADGDLQAPVEVPPGTAYVSLTLDAHLEASVSDKSTFGFAFSGGTGVRYTYCHPFDLVAASPSVAEALTATFKHATFPADLDDLSTLSSGAWVSLAGEGKVSFKGSATLSATANVLATPGLPIVGVASVARTAAVTANAAWTASGELELRVSKPSASQVRFAAYKRRGRSLSLGAKASMGISADVRGSDPIAALMRGISANPEADLLLLVNAGLSDATIETIQEAIAASIDRSLTISAQFEFSKAAETEALFAYDIDLPRLDAAGKSALEDALHGELTGMDDAVGGNGAVRLVVSSARRMRERKSSWRINLLGLVNVASFTQLMQEGTLTFDPVSGALTAADRVSSRRIRVDARPLESNSNKLREVLLESLMVTAAYKASGVMDAAVSLEAGQTYLEQHGRARRPQLEEHYRLLIALGLCDEAERDAQLGSLHDAGASAFVVENRFDAAACDTMFLDIGGQPHTREHFEQLGRQAFLALIPETDAAESYRRLALETDAVWNEVRNLGGHVAPALPVHIRTDAIRLARVNADVVTIAWWASAMHKAANELAAMRKFIGGRPAGQLAADPAFLKARQKLSDALGRVVGTTKALFDDPWDLLAMDAAAARKGRLEAAIVANQFAVRYTDDEAEAPAAPLSAPRGRSARTAPRGSGPERPWTAEEIEIFQRHVVNMRNGRLSTRGSFSSTSDQIRQMFEKWIPAYAERQRAKGSIPRVMFYSHGGLTGEHQGLLPVLARHRFWELNGVYPVYFVWETGLMETIEDIVTLGLRRERGTGPSDFAIEAAARRGRVIWDQMKQSAENTVAADGGARLLAECAGRLWGKLEGNVEFHALGHSAGSIVLAYFLPLLIAQKPRGAPPLGIRTVHFLAPAITSALFKKHLKGLIGAGKPIAQLTMFTMTDQLERADRSLRLYGKSLLYLVRGAFESEAPAPILGLQESLNRDLELIRFFGLAGREKVADVVYSKSPQTAALADRSESTTHGGFDNDIATMTSVARRILGVPAAPVVDYFEEAVPGFDRDPVGTPAAVAAPRSRAAIRQGRKPWTVMVWMAGDNDLEAFGTGDLHELKRIDASDHANVVVQLDRMRDHQTRRYRLQRGTPLERDVVARLGETNTGDPQVAVDFFRWAIQEYPAERLLAVIWNHGSGIDDTNVYERGTGVRRRRPLFQTTAALARRDRAIAFDDTSRDFLDNLELKKVLAGVKRQTGRTIDVLGFDACLMNMIEVAYQLRGTARLVVGSQEVEPADGWPYDRVLEAIVANPRLSNAALGFAIADQFVRAYSGENVTQSALDLSKLETAVGCIDRLSKALTAVMRQPAEQVAITRTLNAVQRFDTPDYVDLGHFCAGLLARSRAASVKSAAKATIASLEADDGLVAAERHKGGGVRHASGVAIYFPGGPVSKVYSKLDFAKATGWGRFLEAYHRA